MKRVAVQSSGMLRDNQMLDNTTYEEGYGDLGAELFQRGARLYITKDHEQYYRGKGNFASGWEYRNGKFLLQKEPFTVDLILNKDSTFAADDTEVINKKEMDILCNDKRKTLELFEELFPKTRVVEREEDLPKTLESFAQDMLVCKPVFGYGGKGVLIGPREKIESQAKKFPVLVQEFIDTEKGIPGVIDTFHDFRMIVANGEVIYTFIRAPRTKTYVGNVSQGGMLMPVPKAMRPPEALALVPMIDAKLQRFGKRIYAIDCARNRDGRWLLIELNSPPGQQSRKECGEDAEEYFEKLCRLLLGD